MCNSHWHFPIFYLRPLIKILFLGIHKVYSLETRRNRLDIVNNQDQRTGLWTDKLAERWFLSGSRDTEDTLHSHDIHRHIHYRAPKGHLHSKHALRSPGLPWFNEMINFKSSYTKNIKWNLYHKDDRNQIYTSHSWCPPFVFTASTYFREQSFKHIWF